MTYRISSILLALAFLVPFVPVHAATVASTANGTAPILVTVKPGEPAPSCKARATKKRITAGGTTTLVWSSKHADTMYGITKGGEWEADGRQKIAIGFTGKKTFSMTFVGEGGIATCVVDVFVHPKKKTD